MERNERTLDREEKHWRLKGKEKSPNSKDSLIYR